MPARPRPSRARALAAALVAAVLVVLGAPVTGSAAAAEGTGTLLLEDAFRGTTVEDPTYRVGGARDGSPAPWSPCLTAGTSTATSPVPGCGLSPADADGAGALRLTPAEYGVNGFVLYDHPLPLRAGLDITFTSYQWGGNGADGLSFFLADGARSLTRAGGYGGALGYSNRGNADGVAGGLLGVGLDAYGNYPLETRNDDCRTSGAWTPPEGARSSDYAYHVSVRGDGEGKRGYCMLGAPADAPELRRRGAARPEAVVARVVVDPPSSAAPMVTVFLDGRQATRVPQPAALARTSTFRFGWGSSTGGQTDHHEIGMISVSSVDPMGPDLALTATSPTEPVASGAAAPLALTARVRSVSGPLPAREPVVLHADAPEGASFAAPAGTGWDCATTTPTRLRCSWTADRATRPGTTLPVLTAPLRSTVSGRQQVVAVVTSASDEPAVRADNTAGAEAVFVPGVEPVDGGEVDAAADPGPLVVALRTDARPQVVVKAGGTSRTGDVRPGTGTEVVLTPAPRTSGLLRGTVAVVDGDGRRSPQAPVVLVVRPVAPPVSGSTRSGEEVVLPAPSARSAPARSATSSSAPATRRP
ncbi:hypothetical protein WDZ17_14065 [Pseudokineococcus basanitobsidens]|uniref:Concanavalin A-like lectin/glucanase superfamily protein n=1 Tax=Pseudokineococcus basanitobsidens TaxID=1926649 RepID=A0ABU8RMV4_9ACTN